MKTDVKVVKRREWEELGKILDKNKRQGQKTDV